MTKMISNSPTRRLAKREPTKVLEISLSKNTVVCMIHSKRSKTNVHNSKLR